MNGGDEVKSNEFTVNLACSTDEITIKAPDTSPKGYVLYQGADQGGGTAIYQFKPFLEKDNYFPTCGFKSYAVSAKLKGTDTDIAVVYPPPGDELSSCMLLSSCTQVQIPNDELRDITLTITATSLQKSEGTYMTVAAVQEVSIVKCDSESSVVEINPDTVYEQVVKMEDTDAKGSFTTTFSNTNENCPLVAIIIVDATEGLEFPKPCDPRSGCAAQVQYPVSTIQTFTFKLQASALGWTSDGTAFHLSRQISIEICDPEDMMVQEGAKLEEVYGLGTQSEGKENQQVILAKAH